MVVSTTAFLVAGRFGLAPTLRQQATSGLRLVDNGTKGLSTGDPAGMQLPSKHFSILIAVQQLGITCLQYNSILQALPDLLFCVDLQS